ncbi:MAG: hypothetical protein AAGF55_09285 [Pseudomonadota bacterium]
MKEGGLEAKLLQAHAMEDVPALISLYAQAADQAESESATDRACFFLTHAWIFALEAGDARAAKLKARLVAHGRDIM